MTGTSAKAHLLDLLLEPLRGCTGLYTYRQELMKKVMKMPALEVKDRFGLPPAHSLPRSLIFTTSDSGVFS